MRPKRTILCVDWNEQHLSTRKFLLETRGSYRVYRAESSRVALEMLEKFIPGTLDMMIVEFLMPGMDGNDLSRRAKQMHPEMPCLITSRTVSSYDRALAADEFFFEGVRKPIELLEKIRVMIAKKRGPKKHYPVQDVKFTEVA